MFAVVVGCRLCLIVVFGGFGWCLLLPVLVGCCCCGWSLYVGCCRWLRLVVVVGSGWLLFGGSCWFPGVVGWLLVVVG